MIKACRRAFAMALVAAILGTGGLLLIPAAASAAGSLELYTPYPSIQAAPGETITHTVEVLNRGSETVQTDIGFQNNGNWSYELSAGGRTIHQLAVKGGESQTLSLRLDVPLDIDKGSYSFVVTAGSAQLPIAVTVAEKGTYASRLEVEQANLEGHSGSTFTFSATLTNGTAEEQTYALASGAESGWEVRFMSGGNSVTSVTVEPNASQSLSVQVLPHDGVKAGTYRIPILAANTNTKAENELEAVVTGTYDLELKTSDERLNAAVKSGGTKTIELMVVNTGSVKMEDISLSAQTPSGWEVAFEPKTVRSLEPGASTPVQAVMTASEGALPGDYALNLSAKSAQKSSDAALRIAVKSSSLWGWIGIVIIAAVAAIVYGLFRKYGRR